MDVYDDAIMPGSTYQLDTILNADECKITEEYGFSAPVEISTVDAWGDVVGDCGVIPCSVPNGVVDFVDISALVDKFRNAPAAPIKARTDLMNSNVSDPLPDRKIDFVDISVCVDAFRGFPPGFPNPYPGPDEIECDPYQGDCYADIRVDSNNDGVIDDFDDAIEETSAVFLVVNSDDDNDNDVADMDEAPVIGEDDLAEIQLTAACDALPDFAWWQLLWDDPEDSIQIWRNEDKSGDAIMSGTEYHDDWPPPESLWLESIGDSEEIELLFTIDDGTGSLRVFSHPRGTKSDKVTLQPGVKGCHWLSQVERFLVVAKRPGTKVSRAGARIETCEQYPLCPEHCPSGHGLGLSGAFVAVVRKNEVEKMQWANMGYARDKLRGGTNLKEGVYAETVIAYCDPVTDDCTDIKWGDPPVSAGHRYSVICQESDGKWWYLLDGLRFHISSAKWPSWPPGGTEAQWSTEILNKEDKMVGIYDNPCRFSECTYNEDWGGQKSDLSASDINYDPLPPVGPGMVEWGYNWVDQATFDVWDKNPIPGCD